MSTMPYVEHLRREQAARSGLPRQASAYLFSTLLLAAIACVAASLADDGATPIAEMVLLLVTGAAAQAFAVHTPGNQIFHTGLAITVAAALVLPPEALVAVCVGQHLPEWLRHRHAWYIQSFNIGNVTLSALVAWGTRDALARAGVETVNAGTAATIAAAAAAATVVLVNHALLAQMLKFARGHSPKATGLFSVDGLAVDLVLGAIGVAIAFALENAPATAPIVALPLLLIHRALVVPGLRAEALRDHKTGVLNARGIDESGRDELARAARYDRPLALLMIDVDGLRDFNNRYGHLAGDAALAAVGNALCSALRAYDLCGRFGGDEFVAILPETTLEEAEVVATRIQDRVDAARVRAPTGEDVAVRVSIGAAARRADDKRLADLVARADAAMYDAKHVRHPH